MQAELQEQKQIRDEMIQNISHDLKTPIATIKSYSESIKDGIYPYGTLEKSVDVIIEHADRLEKKVYSLITFNKLGYLDDTAPEGNTLPMVQVIHKAIVACKVLRSDIEIETDLQNVRFHGEEDPWRIVVENLLDNALRYAKSVVRIKLRSGRLEVFNDGEQLDQAYLQKIFTPYEKGNKGNFGLGLSIVKSIIELHQGYYGVTSTVGYGSDFWFEIPKL
jgi:two-component system sensor histidine kinase CssS